MNKILHLSICTALLSGCVTNQNTQTESLESNSKKEIKEETVVVLPFIEKEVSFEEVDYLKSNVTPTEEDILLTTKICRQLFKDADSSTGDVDYIKYDLLVNACSNYHDIKDKSYYLENSFKKNNPNAIEAKHRLAGSPQVMSKLDIWFDKLMLSSKAGNMYSKFQISKYYSFIGDEVNFKKYIKEALEIKDFRDKNPSAYNFYHEHYFVQYTFNEDHSVENEFIESIYLNYTKDNGVSFKDTIEQYTSLGLERKAIEFLKTQENKESKYELIFKLKKELTGLKATEEIELLIEEADEYNSTLIQMFIYSYYKNNYPDKVYEYLVKIKDSKSFLIDYGFATYYKDKKETKKAILHAHNFINKYKDNKSFDKLRSNMHFIIGTSYVRGINTKINSSEGIRQLNLSANLGNANAYYDLAYCHERNHDDLQYLQNLNKAVELGYGKANIKLGIDYSFDPKIEDDRNFELAIIQFQKGINAGEYDGFYYLGKIHERDNFKNLPLSYANYSCYSEQYLNDIEKNDDRFLYRTSQIKIKEIFNDMNSDERKSVFEHEILCDDFSKSK